MNQALEIDELSNHLVGQVLYLKQFLKVSTEGRAAAVELAKAAELDENALYLEWYNDVLWGWSQAGRQGIDVNGKPDLESWEAPFAYPEATYAAWIKARVRHPFQVSPRAVHKAASRFGSDVAMKMAHVIWDQEIAWAQRTRRSADKLAAVLAEVFLRQTVKDPSREFFKLAGLYVVAMKSLDYITAHEHGLTPIQIRSGHGSSDFVPLVVRYGREFLSASKIASLPPAELEKLASHASKREDDDLEALVRHRSVEALRIAKMRRMTTVIAVAIQHRLDSNALVRAEEMFIAAIQDGKLRLDVEGGLPYSEFIDWIRTRGRPVKEQPATRKARDQNFIEMMGKRRSWINDLPKEYIALGGGDWDRFDAWSRPIRDKEQPRPEDLIADYGFFLVRGEFLPSAQ